MSTIFISTILLDNIEMKDQPADKPNEFSYSKFISPV